MYDICVNDRRGVEMASLPTVLAHRGTVCAILVFLFCAASVFPQQQKVDRILVGGNAQQTKVIRRVLPAYPPEAIAQHVQGAITLHIMIAKDGTLSKVYYVTGPELLAHAAMDAIRQWRYEPPLLNGQPAEGQINITTMFDLGEGHGSPTVSCYDQFQLFDGGVTGNVYHNSVFGFSYTFPQGWSASDPKSLRDRAARNLAVDAESGRQRNGGKPAVIGASSEMVFYTSPSDKGREIASRPPYIEIRAYPRSIPVTPQEAIQRAPHSLQNQGLELIGTPYMWQQNGRNFVRADYRDADPNPRRYPVPWLARIETMRRGYILTMEVVARNRDELNELAGSVESLAFDAESSFEKNSPVK